MPTRVPDNLMYGKGQESLTRVRDKMVKNQEQALTSKRINRPSDDPVGAMRVMSLKTEGSRNEQVLQNLEVANSYLGLTDAALGELGDVVQRAKELAIQTSSTTNATEESRAAVSREVDQLFLRLVQIGNSRYGDRYIFGGYQSDRAPFDGDGNYFGDAGHFELEMDRGQRVQINLPGTLPFFGIDEITQEGQQIRQSPERSHEPTISGQLRAPASVLAQNAQVDPEGDPQKYAQLERRAGVNVFSVMKSFADSLRSNDMTTLHNCLDGFDASFKQVLAARSMTGARQNIVQTSQASLEYARVNNTDLQSRAEDADTLQVFSDLTKNENLLKSSLEVNRKIITPSLIDFLK